jgi:hypothetical protein
LKPGFKITLANLELEWVSYEDWKNCLSSNNFRTRWKNRRMDNWMSS